MELGALRLGAYRLIIIISFWSISPFISMECPSLSHLINVSLKSTLSEISVATPACFQGHWLGNLDFVPFTLSQCLFLSMKWVCHPIKDLHGANLSFFALLALSCYLRI
jgi:hypothetical protein